MFSCLLPSLRSETQTGHAAGAGAQHACQLCLCICRQLPQQHLQWAAHVRRQPAAPISACQADGSSLLWVPSVHDGSPQKGLLPDDTRCRQVRQLTDAQLLLCPQEGSRQDRDAHWRHPSRRCIFVTRSPMLACPLLQCKAIDVALVAPSHTTLVCQSLQSMVSVDMRAAGHINERWNVSMTDVCCCRPAAQAASSTTAS